MMIIGVPKEIKNNENRVAITPAGVTEFVKAGHDVIVEEAVGIGSGFTDEDYRRAGASIEQVETVWKNADMVMKVKEPLPSEYTFFRENLIVFTYLHLAAAGDLIYELMKHKVHAVAYETIQLPDGSLPLLLPMSEVAGRMSVQIGAHFLEKSNGGRGIMLGGVPGVPEGHVVIVGGGVVGTNAAKMALGLRANVTILENNPKRLRELDDLFAGQVRVLMSNAYSIASAVKEADLLIGAVLIPGAKAPQLVTEDMVKEMKQGSVIIDVAVDQGGCIATVDKVTTHDDPVYEKYGVQHYAVANIPGAVPFTSTVALTNATMPYALQIANKGLEQAMEENEALRKGLNVSCGQVTNREVAKALDLEPHTVA